MGGIWDTCHRDLTMDKWKTVKFRERELRYFGKVADFHCYLMPQGHMCHLVIKTQTFWTKCCRWGRFLYKFEFKDWLNRSLLGDPTSSTTSPLLSLPHHFPLHSSASTPSSQSSSFHPLISRLVSAVTQLSVPRSSELEHQPKICCGKGCSLPPPSH